MAKGKMLKETTLKDFTKPLRIPDSNLPRTMKKIGFAAISLVLLVACAEKKLPLPVETVASLQQMQELATVEYTVSKVVKANDNQTWYKVGDRKILITCEATVKAGIDMKEISAGDIVVSGKSIQVQLPAPKILSVNLPPEAIKVAYEDISFFRQSFTSLERDNLLAQAETQIRSSGKELGILDQAKSNTELFLSKFLLQLGFENVVVSYKEDKRPGSFFPINN